MEDWNQPIETMSQQQYQRYLRHKAVLAMTPEELARHRACFPRRKPINRKLIAEISGWNTKAEQLRNGINTSKRRKVDVDPAYSPKPDEKVTTGTIGKPKQAFVYVGYHEPTQAVKIGMSGAPEARCKALRCKLLLAHPVVPSVAKQVESAALVALGARKHDSEWCYCDPSTAIEAVRKARDKVSRMVHADPSLTPEQARLQRASM